MSNLNRRVIISSSHERVVYLSRMLSKSRLSQLTTRTKIHPRLLSSQQLTESRTGGFVFYREFNATVFEKNWEIMKSDKCCVQALLKVNNLKRFMPISSCNIISIQYHFLTLHRGSFILHECPLGLCLVSCYILYCVSGYC